MIELYRAALEVQDFFRSRDWRFALIGGVVVARWGEPRATRDVDISLLVELGRERDSIEAILDRFTARIPDAIEFALANRVLLIEATNDNVPIDVALAWSPFEEEIIDRATPFEFDDGVVLTTVSAEDLVVLKAIAGRPGDWIDIEGIVVRQQSTLDWDAILVGVRTFEEMTGESGITSQLEALRPRTSDS